MTANFCILIRVSLKFVPSGPIDNKAALVQVMAWRRTGDKPLPEPMLTQFTDAYMRHSGDMSLSCMTITDAIHIHGLDFKLISLTSITYL